MTDIQVYAKFTALVAWVVSSAWVFVSKTIIEGIIYTFLVGVGLFFFWFWQRLWEEHKHDRKIGAGRKSVL